MIQKFMNWGLASLLVLIAGAASAQVAVFDTSTNLLTIPSVKVGAETYTNVILKNSFVFTLQDATEQSPAGKGYAIYDTQTMVLTIPAVKLGTATYLDVKLLNTGNFVFMLQSTTQLTASTVGEVNTFFASYDALSAMSLPASGATMFSLDDACYRNDGRTKAYNIADYDPNSALTNLLYAPRIGQRRANLQVLAVRNSVNSNGSSRREIDVQYDAVFTDGSTKKAETETLISGSSQGTSGCSSPQTGSSLRRLGDQRWVGFALQARMTREERYSIATGEALTPSVRYRRDMRFVVTDPVGNATYVVVSGPGPTSYDAKSAGWSWKMVSPRVMRSAPELAGKTGNFTNGLADDTFYYCGAAVNSFPVASASDCLTYGAIIDNWGIGSISTPNAAADQQFTDQGWVAGGAYRIDVYNDDGWKTVNGHASRTPIATYYETLKALPRTFVEMAGTGTTPTSNDQFARFNVGTAAAFYNAIEIKQPTINLGWSLQPSLSSTEPLRLQTGFDYFSGPKLGLASGATWPRLQSLTYTYPGSTATSQANWPVERPLFTDMASVSFYNVSLQYSDRNQSRVRSVLAFQ